MNPNQQTKSRRVFILSLVFVFLAVSVIFLVVTMINQAETNKLKRVEIDISEKSLVQSEQYLITYKINRITSDLRFVYDTMSFYFSNDGDYSNIERLWKAYSTTRTVYDQIRFLDLDGNEVIRVDYAPEGSYAIPPEQLQNKSDRYYFQQAIQLEQGQIYISPADLNVENGAIELPINPVVRLATPLFDQNGVKQGIVVLNYSASDILSQIASIAGSSYGYMFLLNSDGYWLYNSKDPYRDWAFSYDPDSPVKFPNYFPDEWETIHAGESGSFSTENGHFCYSTVAVSEQHMINNQGSMLSCDIGNWYIISYIPTPKNAGVYPSNALFDLASDSLEKYAPMYAILLLFSVVLATYITISKSKSSQVKYFSEYDTMTGAYNRRSGIERLTQVNKNLKKSNCLASICFIDVNGLKQVNDTLGHEAGDALLTAVSSAIRTQIRSEDFLIRLGGDEFLIVYSGIGEDEAEQAWQRILAALDIINQTENRRYLISVSHGIMALQCSRDEMLDDLLHMADVKMYEEKVKIKASVQILREQ